jgi:hypothetical protein
VGHREGRDVGPQGLPLRRQGLPSDVSLEPLDGYQDAALQTQAAGDFDAYEDALRGMMRTALETKTARREAA